MRLFIASIFFFFSLFFVVVGVCFDGKNKFGSSTGMPTIFPRCVCVAIGGGVPT